MNVERTRQTTVRGSHTGTELVTGKGDSFHLGLVKRAQKEGFKGGTLRTIINHYMDDAIRVLLKDS